MKDSFRDSVVKDPMCRILCGIRFGVQFWMLFGIVGIDLRVLVRITRLTIPCIIVRTRSWIRFRIMLLILFGILIWIISWNMFRISLRTPVRNRVSIMSEFVWRLIFGLIRESN